MTDLVVGLGNKVPSSLASIKIAESPAADSRLHPDWPDPGDCGVTCGRATSPPRRRLSRTSRSRSSLSTAKKIVAIETFLAVERALLRHVEESLLEKATDDLLTLGEVPAGLVLGRGDAIDPGTLGIDRRRRRSACSKPTGWSKSLKKPPTTVPALVKAYAEGDSPWCLLDSHHRHMASRWFKFESSDDERQPGKARHQGRPTLHPGRLRTRQAFCHPVPEGEAPDQGRAATGGLV